jgi:hypothetical protein
MQQAQKFITTSQNPTSQSIQYDIFWCFESASRPFSSHNTMNISRSYNRIMSISLPSKNNRRVSPGEKPDFIVNLYGFHTQTKILVACDEQPPSEDVTAEEHLILQTQLARLFSRLPSNFTVVVEIIFLDFVEERAKAPATGCCTARRICS